MAKTEEHLRWLKAISKDRNLEQWVGVLPSLGALTGTDTVALAAIDRCWQVYGYTYGKGVLRAIAELAGEMQPTTRCFARALIAHAMDWGDIDRLWPEVESLLEQILAERRSAPKSIAQQAMEAAARASATAVLIALVFALSGCNGTPLPAVDGAPCAAPQYLSCGYRVTGGVLETRCAAVCRNGTWHVVECLPECGTGAFYGSTTTEKGECYLPTVACPADGGAL